MRVRTVTGQLPGQLPTGSSDVTPCGTQSFTTPYRAFNIVEHVRPVGFGLVGRARVPGEERLEGAGAGRVSPTGATCVALQCYLDPTPILHRVFLP